MTGWSDVITAAMQVIDDERWRHEARINPAQFYRAKSQTVIFALPLLSKPPELLSFLQSKMENPSYADYEYVSTEHKPEGETITVATGITGYELCSVCQRSADGTYLIPQKNVQYQQENGTVTFTVYGQETDDYTIDFYKDGQFPTMTATQIRLMALAISVTWDERFQRDYLSNTMKINDQSFQHVNESNYMDKTNARFIANKLAFEEELRDYEQKCAYYATVKKRMGHSTHLI